MSRLSLASFLFALLVIASVSPAASDPNPFDLNGDGSVTTADFDFDGLPIADNPYNLNGDTALSTADLLIFLAVYGTDEPTADVNCDGVVNAWDLRAFVYAIYDMTL